MLRAGADEKGEPNVAGVIDQQSELKAATKSR
jgi:hypothetical protein